MASPGQKQGLCGHLMAGFDSHAHCARCRDKAKAMTPVLNIMTASFVILPLLKGQMRIAKLKSAHNSCIILPTGLQCKNNLM